MAEQERDGQPSLNAAANPMLAAMATTRSIRRYTNEPVTDEQLAAICFAASRAPSGSNRQIFRFVVLRDGPSAAAAKALVGAAARRLWQTKRRADGYDEGSGGDLSSPKARLTASMETYVDGFEQVPVLVLPCLIRHRDPEPSEGASVYPACQNILLAARAVGLGGVLTQWQRPVSAELAALLDIPDNVFIAAAITIGHPAGNHGPVRRRPLAELVYDGGWGRDALWAVDPEGTRFTQAGPPKPHAQAPSSDPQSA